MPNPYDRPEIAIVGSKSPDQIHKEVGRAISNWERYEQTLMWYFRTLMNVHFFSGEKIFGAILSSSGRHSLIIAAAEAYFVNYPEKLLEVTKSLNLCRHYTGLRNDLAHVFIFESYVSNGEKEYFLQPPIYADSKYKGLSGRSKPIYKYSHVEVADIADRLYSLSDKVAELVELTNEWTNTVPKKTIPPLCENKYSLSLLRSP